VEVYTDTEHEHTKNYVWNYLICTGNKCGDDGKLGGYIGQI
jgi:hypothetical protein